MTEVMAEIRAAVDRKKAAGAYPAHVVSDIEASRLEEQLGERAGPLHHALHEQRRAAEIQVVMPVASEKPYVGVAITGVKTAIQKSIVWYMNGVVGQVRTFADHTVRATGLLAQRTLELEERVAALEAELARRPEA